MLENSWWHGPRVLTESGWVSLVDHYGAKLLSLVPATPAPVAPTEQPEAKLTAALHREPCSLVEFKKSGGSKKAVSLQRCLLCVVYITAVYRLKNTYAVALSR